MSKSPLNRRLYALLVRRFKHVHVVNPGIAAIVSYLKQPNGREQLALSETGEYYRVCCPFCSDTRFRLYIHHTWGLRDPVLGWPRLHLAHCFNEGCIRSIDRQQELRDEVTMQEVDLRNLVIREGDVLAPELSVARWPDPVYPLEELEATHPARHYLISRGFDPDRISKFYGVRYCPKGCLTWQAKNRLIIPVFEDGKMFGWQARYIGEEDWKKTTIPKYCNAPGMQRKNLVYNLSNARRYRTGVAMEGVTDVWALGPMGLCTFGASMTMLQHRKLCAAFRDDVLVMLYDPDMRENEHVDKVRQRLADALPGRFACIWLPDGVDPGRLDRKLLRSYIYDEAKKQGVKVDWRAR